MAESKTPSGFVTFKELYSAYNTTRQTLKKELKKVPGLNLQPMQRLFSPADTKKIFKHLGNPFEQ